MARSFPYEDAAVYLAWRSLRGQRYARETFKGVADETFRRWEQRYSEDQRLKELTEKKKGELGLAQLRSKTIEFMEGTYQQSGELIKAIHATDDPKMAAAYSDAIKALSMMANFAENTLVDTEPLPAPPDALSH